MSLNQDGAAVDKFNQCFPSLETTGPFCSAPIPRLLLHLPSLCCCFPSAGLFWASSEPALGGSLGSGEVRKRCCSGLRCVMDGGVWRCFLQQGSAESLCAKTSTSLKTSGTVSLAQQGLDSRVK